MAASFKAPTAMSKQAVILLLALLLSQQVLLTLACPYALLNGMDAKMPKDHPRHTRKLFQATRGPLPAPTGVEIPPNTCPEASQIRDTCDSSVAIGSFTPTFYEDNGCTAQGGVWGVVKTTLDSFAHPVYGANFVKDCLAPLVRNVFHQDIGGGHNGVMLLEDYGSRFNPRSTPVTNMQRSGSAKYANPNQSLRCYDIYELLRTEVDKYTAANCRSFYVSCTDLTNFAARYAHWKLSGEKFLPCFNYGFADREPSDFSSNFFSRSPKDSANQCMPPRDSGDTNSNLPLSQALSAANFDSFFNRAISTFTRPCFGTSSPLEAVDLSNLLAAHSFGESHCSSIRLSVKEPLMNATFHAKLVSDCNKCRTAVSQNRQPDPYGDFASNMNPSLRFSFAQKCKTAGVQDFFPSGKTSGISRAQTDPCCVPNDVFTPDTFDFAHYPQVMAGLGILEVDNGLARHPSTLDITADWAQCSQTQVMFGEYQKAWNKMNLVGARPHDGRRRKFCSAPTWARV